MGMIETLTAMLQTMDTDRIVVHEERCVVIRNQNAQCLRCVESCTTGSLSVDAEGTIVVDPSLCIGCGTCATACPTSAIELRTPTDDELTRSLKASIVATQGHPVIACEQAVAAGANTPKEDAVVIAPCLGRTDESFLVGAAAYRASDITLVCGACETCEHNHGGILTFDVAESAASLLEAYGVNFAIEFADELPEHVIDPDASAQRHSLFGSKVPTTASPSYPETNLADSRRDFVVSAKDSAKEFATAALKSEAADRGLIDEEVTEPERPVRYRKVGKDGTLTHFVPTRRVRLYNYLKHVGSGEPVAESVTSRVIGSIQIDADKCNACRMCAIFCPTEAIAKVDEDDVFGIRHRPSACVQCRACESICPKGAITVSNSVPTRQFIGKEALIYAMKKPTWTPNKPDSMYNKIHTLLGEDLEMCMF